MKYHVPAIPVSKPRQTRSDRWKQRPCVLRYRAFADIVRLNTRNFKCKGHLTINFYLPFPKSYSEKKREALAGMAHTVKPDIDNLIKSVLDSLYKDDSTVWGVIAHKYWQTSKGPGVDIITDEEI